MTKYNYPSTSPYAVTPQTSWYIGQYVHRSIPVDGDDTLITLDAKYNNRPDILSNDLYGSPAYWWVFMIRNMNTIRDPIWDFKTGIQIYIPSIGHLEKILGN